ncbi:cyclin-I-like [Halichondria panicea]|uniref:cyclin-I-like n=1 Tax=Halichondria panicea TaxID=6063 RepID=UPI00312B5234
MAPGHGLVVATQQTNGTTYNPGLLSLSSPLQKSQVDQLTMSTVLETRLHAALATEQHAPPPTQIYYQEESDSEFVNSYDRDEMVRWLCLLTHDLHYRLEVFFRATNLLDTFLSLVKVRPKYLQCVTATCFYIGAKLEEKAEALQSLLEVLVQGYGCEFSQRDIQRMELIVMQKLDFKLTNYTPHDFLKMFHLVGVTEGSLSLPGCLSPEQHLCHTSLCLEAIVTNHTLMKFRPSLLALAVLGCDLKLLGCDWLTAVVTLQSLSKIQGRELSVCYESVLSEYSSVALQYPLLVTPYSAPVVEPPREGTQETSSFNLCTRTDLEDLPPASVGKHLVPKKTLIAAQ